MVAICDEQLVGHVAVSPVTISDDSANWYGLGPISVLPGLQGHGIGSRLMNHALDALKNMGAAGCVLLGDPGYYYRFGFKVIDGLYYTPAPRQYFQALPFSADVPQGEVTYHKSFSASH